MNTALGQIILVVFVAIWFGGMIVLFFRVRAKQVVYLKRFPPVNGVPLEMFLGGNPFGPEIRAINHAMRQHQTDPELERLRREMWRRNRYQIIWTFGFPLLGAGVVAILILTGQIH
jgi:hypothetical protein